MGEADCLARNYFGDTSVFADVFNMLCFNCRPVISAERLEPVPTDVIDYNVKGKRVPFSRDLLMRLTRMEYGGGTLALLGLEHQSHVTYDMPLRCMHYDVMSLRRQCRKKSRPGACRGKDALFVGNVPLDERLTPVLTAVVYVGPEPWNGPCSLREMMKAIPEEIAPYFNDYRMLLLTPEAISEDMLPLFQSDLGKALYYARLASDKEKLREFIERTKLRLSCEAVEFLNASLNTKIKITNRKEDVDMCKAWDEQFEDGRKEGRMEGRMEVIMRLIEALRPQKNDEELCDYLQKMLGMTYEQAQTCLASH